MGFDDYKKREIQLSDFNKWADSEGLDLRMSGEFEYSDKETQMSCLGYKAGQQSQQAKIDELQKRIDEALSLIGNLNSENTVGFMSNAMIKILKGKQNDQPRN